MKYQDYWNAEINKDIYIGQPEDFEVDTGENYCKLNPSLHRIK